MIRKSSLFQIKSPIFKTRISKLRENAEQGILYLEANRFDIKFSFIIGKIPAYDDPRFILIV